MVRPPVHYQSVGRRLGGAILRHSFDTISAFGVCFHGVPAWSLVAFARYAIAAVFSWFTGSTKRAFTPKNGGPPKSGGVAMLHHKRETSSGGTSPTSTTIISSTDGGEQPYTPRHSSKWYERDPSPELVQQCLRPGHCGLRREEERDWLHGKLVSLGHAFNERGELLMAQAWFQCSYAIKPTPSNLLSAANMRLKLGQHALAEELYRRIVRMELHDEQREMVYRKLGEATTLKSLPISSQSTTRQSSPSAELPALLSAPAIVSAALAAADSAKMLPLLRVCAFAANKAADFEAASLWFDCSYALSAASCDLLAAANMRAQVDPVSVHTRSRQHTDGTRSSSAAFLSPSPRCPHARLLPHSPLFRCCANAQASPVAAAVHRRAVGPPSTPPTMNAALPNFLPNSLPPGAGLETSATIKGGLADSSSLGTPAVVSSVLCLSRLEERLMSTCAALSAQQDRLVTKLESHTAVTEGLQAEVMRLQTALARSVGRGSAPPPLIMEGVPLWNEEPSRPVPVPMAAASGHSCHHANGGCSGASSSRHDSSRLSGRGLMGERSCTPCSDGGDSSPPSSRLSGASPPPKFGHGAKGKSDVAKGEGDDDDDRSKQQQLTTRRCKKGGAALRSGAPDLDDAAQAWALIETDADVGTLLKDVRSRIGDYADKAARKQPQVADLESEGTLYVQLLNARGLLAADGARLFALETHHILEYS